MIADQTKDTIIVDFSDIAWNVHVRHDPTDEFEDCDYILEWGWTAGMSEEDIKNLADDAPSGCEKVRPCNPHLLCVELAEKLGASEKILESLAKEFDLL